MTLSKDLLIQRIASDLQGLNSSDFERVACDLVELLEDTTLLRKGRTLKGQSRSIAVDGVDHLERIVAEASVENDYFKKRKRPDDDGLTLSDKIKNDITHALDRHPKCSLIYLCSTQSMPQNGLGHIRTEVTKHWNQTVADSLRILDCELLAQRLHTHLTESPVRAGHFTSDVPSIRGIAFSTAPPRPTRLYVSRPNIESKLVNNLEARTSISALVGLSGSGKSEVAKHVLQEQDSWDNILWLTQENDRFPQDLYSVTAANINEHINVLNIISDPGYSTLVVLDGVREDPAGLINHFLERRGNETSLLITSDALYPSLKTHASVVDVGPLEDTETLALLDLLCGDADNSVLADAITTRADALPSLILLLGGLINANELSREEALSELSSPHRITSSSGATLEALLLDKHRNLVGQISAAVRLFGTRIVEKTLFRRLAPSMTTWTTLRDRALLMDEGNGLYTLNAILYHAASEQSGDIDADLNQDFSSYLVECRLERPSHFFINLGLLESRIRATFMRNPQLDIFARAYLEIEDSKPDADALEMLREKITPLPPPNDPVAIECWFEVIERTIIRSRDEQADKFTEESIAHAETLCRTVNTPYCRFHLGKLYAWGGKLDAARDIFESLWATATDATMRDKLRLQLVTLDEKGCTNVLSDDPADALQLVLDSDFASLRMKLGALERARATARTRHLIGENLDFLNETLRMHLSPTFIQPLRTVSWILSKLSWEDPALATRMVDGIKWQYVDTKNDGLRWMLGEIRLKSAKRKGLSDDEKVRELRVARELFLNMPTNSEYCRFYVETLDLLGDTQAVDSLLEHIDEAKMDIFFHHACAKSYKERRPETGLRHIEMAKSKMSNSQKTKFGNMFVTLEEKIRSKVSAPNDT